jgi:molybdopterin-guanine dinucleotide biosynthesis protein A
MKTLGVILAGGLSTRMGGGDKSLLPLNDTPLLRHVIIRITPQVDGTVLNANGDARRFGAFSLPIAPDSIEGYAGPLAGILAGMDYAAYHGFTHIQTVAADTPFFPTDLVQRMSANAQAINIARDDNAVEKFSFHPTFGLWDIALRDELRASINDGMRKVMGFVKQHDWRGVTWKTDECDPFFNVNTPNDMAQAEMIIQGMNT